MQSSPQNPLLYQIRRLSQALILSMALNVGLIAAFFYWIYHERPPIPYYELKPATEQQKQLPLADERSSAQVIQELKMLPFDQLVAKLENSQLVENGYSQRDLALAGLVAWHHFDIKRALLAYPPSVEQQRLVHDEHGKGITIYSNLSDAQFQAAIQFANTEKWPLTPQGLFLKLQQLPAPQDFSLVESFVPTTEFSAVEMIFARAETRVDRDELLTMLKEGTWEMLSQFTEQQRSSQDLSPARRQRLLLDYIDKGSRTAAVMLLKTDPVVAAKKLDDHHIVVMLEMLQDKKPEVKTFALELLLSPRSDVVRKAAAQKLYNMAGEPFPQNYSHTAALAHFAPHRLAEVPKKTEVAPTKIATLPKQQDKPKAVIVKNTPKSTPNKVLIASKPPASTKSKEKIYIVQTGDTLWKISKKFNVEVGVIKAYNRLQTNDLKPGATLRIP
jgi:LysM repeat protein